MTMQLFSFGHPCEHQLRRTCIGGASCPLNGYPDNWCCSFIKGKINFKRDKPCEGPRCRWGFSHPSQSQFDAVTQVLNESRVIAAKIDDAADKEILTFTIDNSHIVDTVQCTLHMLRHTPSNCAMRVGQLLAYAALRAGCAKVFVQLLKTLKKPLDGYLLGAHDYLTNGSLPTVLVVNTGSNTNANNNTQGKAAGKKGSSEKKEDVSEELKNDVVDLMNAALSSGGQLVNREDQHTLQAVFIQALRSYPKSNKKRHEMLELAVSKFGSRPGPKNPTLAAAVAGQTTANNANNASTNVANNNANNHNSTSHTTAATTAAGAAYSLAHTGAPTAAAIVASNINTHTSMSATAAAANNTANTSTQSATQPTATLNSTPTSGNAPVACGGHSSKTPELLGEVANNFQMNSNSGAGGPARRQVAVGSAQAPLAIGTRQKDSCGTTHVKQQQQQQQQQQHQQQAQPQQQHVVGISRLAQQLRHVPFRHYDPIRTDKPLPNVALFGGLFGLTVHSSSWALLGCATCQKPSVSAHNTATGPAASLGISSASSLEVANEGDAKGLRFLSSAATNYNMFGGVDGLLAEQQLLKAVYDEVSL